MRAHWFRTSSSIVALVLGISGAHAQDAARTQPTTAPDTASGGVEVGGVETRAAVSPQEQIAQADDISRRAGLLAERLSRMLDEARREKDIMRANCVNRKLTEVNANARNVEQRTKALRDANAVNDSARRGHEYTVLTVLSQKLSSLDQEAMQCLGQSVYEPGASTIVTTIPSDVTTIDPSTVVPNSPPSPTFINPVLGSGGM